MLSDRCPVLSCLSCLSVTLVYCGQTVGRINIKLDMQVGLGPGNIVLDGDPATPKKRAQPLPNFWPMSVVAKRLDGLRCHLVVLRCIGPTAMRSNSYHDLNITCYMQISNYINNHINVMF